MTTKLLAFALTAALYWLLSRGRGLFARTVVVEAPEAPQAGYSIAPWRTAQTLAASTLFSSGWLQLEQHSVRTEQGAVIDDWLWVGLPSTVSIMVRDQRGRFLLLRQGKYGLAGSSVGVIGG